jgi:signal transduction histidine kinase
MLDSMSPKSTAPNWEAFALGSTDNSGIKILTVDDNEASRYSIVRSLREAGYSVLEARTGQEALARVAESPDLITLDVNLPDVHGFELCRQIKSNPATAHIPVLHLSCTSVDPDSRVKGLASGADGYLTEPVDRAELVATVAALLRLKSTETLARQQAELAESARQQLATLNQTLESRVNERTAQLSAANESLRELSARLLRMQDEERRRIARELHDSVGQLLAAIKMNNAAVLRSEALSPHAQQLLQQNSEMVEEILSGIRTISHLLHPPLLDEAGLPSALQWYVEEFGERSGIEVHLDCDTEIGRLPSLLETAIFRIAQECLGNVHRHSDSPVASVKLTTEDGIARLEIRDVGRGIPSERLRDLTSYGRGGVGLRGLRERVTELGGKLEIHSAGEGTGTTVVATLPCSPPAADSVTKAATAD